MHTWIKREQAFWHATTACTHYAWLTGCNCLNAHRDWVHLTQWGEDSNFLLHCFWPMEVHLQLTPFVMPSAQVVWANVIRRRHYDCSAVHCMAALCMHCAQKIFKSRQLFLNHCGRHSVSTTLGQCMTLIHDHDKSSSDNLCDHLWQPQTSSCLTSLLSVLQPIQAVRIFLSLVEYCAIVAGETLSWCHERTFVSVSVIRYCLQCQEKPYTAHTEAYHNPSLTQHVLRHTVIQALHSIYWGIP